MPTRPSLPRALFVTAAACLALGACREDARSARTVAIDPLPATLAAPMMMAPAPDAWALPDRGPAPIGRLASRDRGYAWAERAYAMDHAFYDLPPAYAFGYDEVEPWAWETDDDWSLYVEPLAVGYRYYYYEPEADHPYFVRDPDYGYGFDEVGRVVVIYDITGRLLPESYLIQRADVAGRYYARARDLRHAAEEGRRRRIEQDRWIARRDSLSASQAAWIQAAERQEDWRDYRERTDSRDLRRFRDEAGRREAPWADRWPDRQARAERAADDGRRAERREDGERRLLAARAEEQGRGERERRAMGERRHAQDRFDEQGGRERARQDRGRAEARGKQEREARGERRQAQIEADARERHGRERGRPEGPDQREQARAESHRRGEEAGKARHEAEAAVQRERRAEGEHRREQARAEAATQHERRAEGQRRQEQARAEGQRRRDEADQARGRAEAESRRQQAQAQEQRDRPRAESAERQGKEAADRQPSSDQHRKGGGDKGARGDGGGGDQGRGRKKD